MPSIAEILERLGLRAKKRYDDAPAKQAENEKIARELRGMGSRLATESKVGQLRQHYDAHSELWGTPFAAWAKMKYPHQYQKPRVQQ